MSKVVSTKVMDEFTLLDVVCLQQIQVHYWGGTSTDAKVQQALLEVQYARRETASTTQSGQDARARQEKDQELQEILKENSALRKALCEMHDHCMQLQSLIQQSNPTEPIMQTLPKQVLLNESEECSADPALQMDAEAEPRGRRILRSAVKGARRRNDRGVRSPRVGSATSDMAREKLWDNEPEAKIVPEENRSL